MQLGDYSCGHHEVGIAPQYKSRSSYDILKGIMSEYVILFYLFIFKQYLVRGAQFIEAGLNGALMKKEKQHTRQIKKKNGATKVWRGLILPLSSYILFFFVSNSLSYITIPTSKRKPNLNQA